MTFMPCNVGMQLCCRSGTGFALLQLVGALGSTLGRNIDFSIQMLLGVTVENVSNWPMVMAVSGCLRVAAAFVVLYMLPSLWESLEKSLDGNKKKEDSEEAELGEILYVNDNGTRL